MSEVVVHKYMIRKDFDRSALHEIDPETGEGYCNESQRQYKGSMWHHFHFTDSKISWARECHLCKVAKAKKERERKEMSQGKFWMVMQLTGDAVQRRETAPCAKHYDKAKAVAEMGRLARAYSGKTFALLEAMEVAQVNDLVVTTL